MRVPRTRDLNAIKETRDIKKINSRIKKLESDIAQLTAQIQELRTIDFKFKEVKQLEKGQ